MNNSIFGLELNKYYVFTKKRRKKETGVDLHERKTTDDWIKLNRKRWPLTA